MHADENGACQVGWWPSTPSPEFLLDANHTAEEKLYLAEYQKELRKEDAMVLQNVVLGTLWLVLPMALIVALLGMMRRRRSYNNAVAMEQETTAMYHHFRDGDCHVIA